jgi:hypothetical protein
MPYDLPSGIASKIAALQQFFQTSLGEEWQVDPGMKQPTTRNIRFMFHRGGESRPLEITWKLVSNYSVEDIIARLEIGDWKNNLAEVRPRRQRK